MAVEAPTQEGVQAPPTYVPPVTQEPLKVKAGDKFRAELDKLTKPQESGTDINESSEEGSQPDIQKKAGSVSAPEKPVEKPASPLDAVLATTPKEPEKVEEPDVLKEFDEAKPDWKRARGVMKTQSEQIRELTGKVKTLETAPKGDPAAVVTLSKQLEEAKTALAQREDAIKSINAEYSDEYQSLVKDRETVLGKIGSRVKAYGGDANGLIEALALPEGKIKTAQIKEALAELDPDDKPRIHALIETLESHDEKIADFRKDLPKKWDEIQARRDIQAREQGALQLKNLETQYGKVTERLPELSVTFREVSDDVPGGSEWNKEIRDALQGGLAVLKPDGADFEGSAIIAAKGQRYDSLEKRYLSLHSDYTELKRQYGELSGAGPDFKGGGKPTTKVDKKPGTKYHEALATIQGAGLGEV